VEAQLARQGIQAEALFSAPTPLNSLLWRVVVLDGEYYHEALVSWFDQEPPRLSRLPRGTALARVLADSPAHRRLAWFTDGVLRYDQIGDHLVVTDLRLGMTGFHPFRFDFATHHEGEWQIHQQVDRWPATLVLADLQRLQVLWWRIWQADVEVPLVAWANELSKPQREVPCSAGRDGC
jgi:inner membrane protein